MFVELSLVVTLRPVHVNSQEVRALTWRAFSLAVAHEEVFSLAVAGKVRAIPLTTSGFNVGLMKEAL